MSTPEGKVKEKVKALLRRFGVYWHMPVQNGMGAPSLDFICCVPCVITQDMVGQRVGLYVAIETKAENKSFTPRQEHTASLIQAAGAPSFLVNESCGTKYVEEWLERVVRKSPASTSEFFKDFVSTPKEGKNSANKVAVVRRVVR